MTLTEIVNYLNGIAWGPWMLILLVGTGVYLSARVGFIQFAKFGHAMKNTVGKLFQKQTAGEGEVTPFQALTTALAATVGTGNIAGVTGAIFVGGPGAVFWMWVSAFFGMCTKYSEILLAMKYRETDENGIYDEETAKNSKANKQGGTMMWIMPLISLWIGFSIPGALSLYWVAQGIFSLAADIYLTKKYRHIYDMEDAERLALLKERQELEAEKERQRAARRAANPDGITTNTSKKKMQQAKQEQKDAAKAAAARKYAIEKGLLDENEVPENLPLSGIADRPNCKGRAYDPDRYKEK